MKSSCLNNEVPGSLYMMKSQDSFQVLSPIFSHEGQVASMSVERQWSSFSLLNFNDHVRMKSPKPHIVCCGIRWQQREIPFLIICGATRRFHYKSEALETESANT